MAAGQPTLYRREFHNQNFLELSKQGKSIVQIAARWEVSRETIYEWGRVHKEFSDTLSKGKILAENWYADLGQAAMIGAAKVDGKAVELRVNTYKWLTANMFGWSQKIDMKSEHSGPDGSAIKLDVGETRADRIKRLLDLLEKTEQKKTDGKK